MGSICILKVSNIILKSPSVAMLGKTVTKQTRFKTLYFKISSGN